jgi:cytochrome c553
MTRLVRVVAKALVGLAVLAVVAAGAVFTLSERELARTHEVPAVTISIPTDAASIDEGRRLATVRGCFGGCHGKQAEGRVMFDDPMIARVVAPNLPAAVRKYSDAELVAVIRNGVRPGGRSFFVMPSSAFVGLTDEDVGRIIAFLKTLPAVPGPQPSSSLGPLGRVGVAIGKFKTEAQLIAETVPPPEAANPEASRGRYLARTICAHCHGTDLRGASNPDFVSPNLAVVTAYSPEAFTNLLRKGEPLGGRKLGTMGPWARGLLSHLTDSEISALYGYLHATPPVDHK